MGGEVTDGEKVGGGQEPLCSLPWIIAWIFIVALLATGLGLVLFFLLPLALGSSEGDSPPPKRDSVTAEDNPLLLPQDVWPLEYRLRLTTFLDYDRLPNRSFVGQLDVLLSVKRPTDILRFHSLHLSFTRGHISLRPLGSLDESLDDPDSVFVPSGLSFDNYTQMVTLELGRELMPGTNYSLSIAHFRGRIRIDAKGLYLSTYTTATGQHRFLTATQFEVAEARKVFPCWDEPRFKARFRVTIVRRASMRSIANMPLIRSKTRGDGYVEDHYDTSVLMSTYLVAFVISDFDSKMATTEDDIRVRAFARPDLIGEVDHALDMTQRTLKYFKDYFDIPYALKKLDLIALPDFSHGAMENWGLITFKEKTMLYNPSLHPRHQKEQVSMIVGHEVAHQWFGNLVTMEWWNDLWLNEGFSHYMGYVATAAVDPDEPMEHEFILTNVMEALKMDSMLSTHPVLNEVFHPDEIVTLFDTITYKKGSCLIRMMVHFLGEDVMRSGLQIYLKRHAYANSVSANLWAALNEAADAKAADYRERRMSGLSVETVMDNWIRQTGYPCVMLERSYDGSRTATITQQRFVVNSHLDDKNGVYNETWYIPFTYTNAAERDWVEPTMTWLHQDKETLSDMPGNEEWVMGNVNLNGFYRVNYDDRNWALIIRQLERDHNAFSVPQRAQVMDSAFELSSADLVDIRLALNSTTYLNMNWALIIRQLERDHNAFSVPQRAQVMDSAFELSSADLVDIRLALNSTTYLKSEEEYLPWSVGFGSLKYVDTMLQDHAEYRRFQRYARELISPSYKRLGWEEVPGEHKHRSYLRNVVMDQACYYGTRSCLDQSRRLFRHWMHSGSLDQYEFKPPFAVQCMGVREGGKAEWDWVWARYLNATGNTDRMNLLKGLTCVKDPTRIQELLSASLNSSLIKTWHVAEVMRDMCRFLSGRQFAWDFIRRNWNLLYDRLKELTGDLGSCLKYFGDEYRLKEVDNFLSDKPDGPEVKKFTQYRESIEFNVHWRESNAQKVPHSLHKAYIEIGRRDMIEVVDWLRDWERRGTVN